MPYDENGYWYDEYPEAPDRVSLSAHIVVQRVGGVPGFPVGSIIWDGDTPTVIQDMDWGPGIGALFIAELAVVAVAAAGYIYDQCGASGVAQIAAYIAVGNPGQAASVAAGCMQGFGLDEYN